MKTHFKTLLILFVSGVSTSALRAQPVNDSPCSAITLSVTEDCQYQSFTTVGATNTAAIPAPPCGFTGKDVWFQITVPASGMFTIETAAGSILDGMMAVYTGTCDDLTHAYCDDDSGEGLMPMLDLQGFIPGSTAYIRFYKRTGGTGTFSICVWDNNPPIAANDDCYTAQQLCTTLTFSSNSVSDGEVDDLDASNKGCLTPNENQSSWFYFTFSTPGEFNFTIDPINPDDNYNFALWGPDLVCPLVTDPIRCSYSNSPGATGINTGSTDVSEGIPGDNWVKFLNPNPGETYILLIDNYSESGEGFTFTFNGPPNIGCEVYLLPVELIQFTGTALGNSNLLQWTTSSEVNNDMFMIEQAQDAENFVEIGSVFGAGYSESAIDYTFIDINPFSENTYYRLNQIDFNGASKYSEIIQVENVSANYFSVTPNPANGFVNIEFNLNGATEYTLEILNTYGTAIYNKHHISVNELIQENLLLPNKGVFWIQLKTNENKYVRQIVNY